MSEYPRFVRNLGGEAWHGPQDGKLARANPADVPGDFGRKVVINNRPPSRRAFAEWLAASNPKEE